MIEVVVDNFVVVMFATTIQHDSQFLVLIFDFQIDHLAVVVVVIEENGIAIAGIVDVVVVITTTTFKLRLGSVRGELMCSSYQPTKKLCSDDKIRPADKIRTIDKVNTSTSSTSVPHEVHIQAPSNHRHLPFFFMPSPSASFIVFMILTAFVS
jgi:hypothetical protein